MKKTAKTLICALLAAVLTLGLLAAPATLAFADGGALTETANWSMNDGTFTVSGTGDIPMGAINNVTKTMAAEITAVKVGSGITSLGNGAFQGLPNLVSAELPDTMYTVPNSCFAMCAKLQTVKLPAKLRMIAGIAFMNCTSLAQIDLPGSLKCIDADVFHGCTALKSVSLPAGLVSLGANVFYEAGLESIVVPAGVRSIGAWAFAWCENLKSAILACDITSLPDCVFQGSALEYVVLPASLKTVYEATFYNCTLKQIYFEGTQEQFNEIVIVNNKGPIEIDGTTSKLFQTAAVSTAAITPDMIEARGDIDGKDGVQPGDARLALRASLEVEPIETVEGFYCADADHDATLTPGDARLILRDSLGLEDLKTYKRETAPTADAVLDELQGFTGTLPELLRQYEPTLLYGASPSWGAGVAVFIGETDTVVMMFATSQGAYFVRRFTPTAASAALEAVKIGDDDAQLDTIDPGIAHSIYQNMGGYVSPASMCVSTDGHVYMFATDGGKVTGKARL